MSLSVIWFAAFAVFVIIEACTYQIVSIWLAIGALGGFAAYCMGFEFYVQMIVFLVISFALLGLLRPVSLRLMKNKGIKTNADSLIGKEVLITEAVDNIRQTGKGKVGGMEWTVRSVGDERVEAGASATVVKIEGVKIMVKGKEE